VNGQGNAELGAPRIAGLDAQYIGRQLADFRDRRRGTGDSFGEQMITIASVLDETTIGRLSAYVSTLPEAAAPPTLKGDRKAGESAFTTCAACHGARAEGNADLGAPRLAGMSDWYLAR
jgi:cytochrome c oxidase subunit 2